MGQIITTQNLVAIKEVRHAGQQVAMKCNVGLGNKWHFKPLCNVLFSGNTKIVVFFMLNHSRQ